MVFGPIAIRPGVHRVLLKAKGDFTVSKIAPAIRLTQPFLTLDEPSLERVYGKDALLVRPDQHIAWRGSEHSVVDAGRIFARALGWEWVH
jgi:hypothetical protein